MLWFSITAARITDKLYLYIISIYSIYTGYMRTPCRKNIISLFSLHTRSCVLGQIHCRHNCRIPWQQLYIISICLIYIDNAYFSILRLSFSLISTAWCGQLLHFQKLLIDLNLTLLYIKYMQRISLWVYLQCLMLLHLNA